MTIEARSLSRRGTKLLVIAIVLVMAVGSCGRLRVRAQERRSRASQPVAQPENSIRVGGAERSYDFVAPTNATGEAQPLMILLHGGLGNADAIRNTTGMDQLAEREGFFLAIPNGTSASPRRADKRTWNAGTCCGPAQRDGVDDVAFIRMLVKELAARYPIDLTRVYATGFSNGGMLAYRLACEMPDVIAAAMPVAGAVLVDDCAAGKNVAIFAIHGDSDQNVRYEGGKGRFVRTVYPSVSTSVERITRTRGCDQPTKTSAGKDRVEAYSCANGSTVRLRTVAGGGHRWPDGSATYEGFSATNAIWTFAKQHRRQ